MEKSKMPTLVDSGPDPPTQAQRAVRTERRAAARLRAEMAAVRLSFVWFGVRKTLTQEQQSQAAGTFGAEREFLSAAKKLLDTSHPAFRAVTSVKSRIVAYWRGVSLPYPEPGIRLVRQGDIAMFSERMVEMQAELAEAVDELCEQ
jgi:hypothetical protein